MRDCCRYSLHRTLAGPVIVSIRFRDGITSGYVSGAGLSPLV
jgi:hypothetical protein